MISSAIGYEWVNVAGLSSFITGDILPVRDNRGDGSWQRLKYEDLLFLMEAQLERANWRYASSASVTPLGRALNRTLTINQGIWPSESGWVNEYLDREAAMPTGIVATTSSATIPAACGIGAAPFAARPANNYQRLLAADDIRTMFYNVKLATRTVTSVTAQDLAISWTGTTVYTKSDGSSGPPSDPFPSWGVLWNHGNATRVGSPYDVISITYKSEIATYPHASAATLLVKVKSNLDGGTVIWYDVVALPCSVTAGAVAVPSLSGLAQQIAALHGLNYTTAPGYIKTGGGNISITDMALVVDHVFPAEINSVNWNWSPQSS